MIKNSPIDWDIYKKKNRDLNDIIIQSNWIKFGCWGLSIQSLAGLFIGVFVAISIILWQLISSWIIGEFSKTYFALPLLIGLCFADVAYRRGISCIQVYNNKIIVKKYKNLICTMKYELSTSEIEYVIIKKTRFAYNVSFKIKNEQEELTINNIIYWEDLKKSFDIIRVKISEESVF